MFPKPYWFKKKCLQNIKLLTVIKGIWISLSANIILYLHPIWKFKKLVQASSSFQYRSKVLEATRAKPLGHLHGAYESRWERELSARRHPPLTLRSTVLLPELAWNQPHLPGPGYFSLSAATPHCRKYTCLTDSSVVFILNQCLF